ncbi:MAG TPA: tRNA (adenosine(37)-N6)-threonylcarbamoyltransferase complex transferase subunit TsaD [Candidatus Paceibacterota bacterium]|nr:tRNA (adenosine(37)-N6)-threonylcarbamoyltransferase complex transferase subunit TsaD [Candidatus Paceibacterota bacterium]
MKILSIETSCDETAVSVLECSGDSIVVLGNALASQVDLHAAYGGVFPAMAKRAHTEKIIPLLTEALRQAGLLTEIQHDRKHSNILENTRIKNDTSERNKAVQDMCTHEKGLAEQIISFGEQYAIPDINHIAVTAGPGLEPALWVGVNTAEALATLWDKPLSAINHMEGHVISAVFEQKSEKSFSVRHLQYPALALLVSGGHTELVLIDAPRSYKKIGETRDDAVGEAFDKVARILGLSYPGGPKISVLAREARDQRLESTVTLPRPMLHSGEYDFSFSGIKTAVLYLVRDLQKKDATTNGDSHSNILENTRIKYDIAREFEDAVVEVLVKKTFDAINEYHVQTLIVGGGVAANTYLRAEIEKRKESDTPDLAVHFPTKELSTDNSIMIGMALYYQLLHGQNKKAVSNIKADGNLSIENQKSPLMRTS